MASEFGYTRVIKHQRRQRTVEVERRILCADQEGYRAHIKMAGFSGIINTANVAMLLIMRPRVQEKILFTPIKF